MRHALPWEVATYCAVSAPLTIIRDLFLGIDSEKFKDSFRTPVGDSE